MPFTSTIGANVRNWIVAVNVIDDDTYIYGPYTKAAAVRAAARAERWAKKHKDDYQQIVVSSYPIHQWGKADEDGR